MTIRNDTRLEDFLKRVKDYGKAEGDGLNAKPSYALDVVQMAHEGVVGDDHAEGIWDKFKEASSKTKGVEKLKTSTAKTDKVRVSETRQLIAVGSIAAFDPSDVMNRAVAIIQANNDVRGSTYQNLVVVARAQIKQRASALSDDDITKAITPVSPEAKDEQEQLTAHIKRLKRMHDGDEKDPSVKAYPSPELASAIKSLESRLATLVGNEQMDKLFALAAERGLQVVAKPEPEETPAELEAA